MSAPVRDDGITYREMRAKHTDPPRILHIALASTNYTRAYCGKRRDLPLAPGAEGDYCVVCLAEFERAHDRPWSKS